MLRGNLHKRLTLPCQGAFTGDRLLSLCRSPWKVLGLRIPRRGVMGQVRESEIYEDLTLV
jgi:hypothetical protein